MLDANAKAPLEPVEGEPPSVLSARVQLLFENAASVNIAVLLTATLIAVLLSSVIPLLPIAAWLASIIAVSLLRLRLVMQRQAAPASRSDPAWLKAYIHATARVGIAWAVVPAVLMPAHSIPHQFLIIVLVFALASAGIAVLSCSFTALMVYTLPAIAALILRLTEMNWLGEDSHTLSGLLILAIYPLMHIQAAKKASRALLDALRLDAENRSLIERLKAHQTGLERQIEAHTAKLREANQQLQLEVAERRAAQRDSELSRDAALRANRAKSEFLANMSHELRTPMHGILSFSGLGAKRSADLQALRINSYFKKIEHCGKRLMSLLNRLLDLAELEAGRITLQRGPCPLAPLLCSLADELLPLAEQAGVHLQLPPLDTAPELDADPDRLLQVLLHLTANALSVAPAGSEVRIDWQPSRLSADDAGNAPAAAALHIRDRGPGIPEDEMASIFEQFVQSSQTKTGAGGSGLGLAICREIVVLHGGQISAANRDGGGAVFTLQIPLQAAH